MRRTMATVATRTEFAVLGLLAWQGESTGYELHKVAESSVGFIWAPARSQLYAVLKRLDAADLVAGRRVVQTDRPDKRLFRITDAGRATLRAWLDELEPIEPEDRDGILLKHFFGAFGDPEAGRRQLLDYRERAASRLDTYEAIEREFAHDREKSAARRLQTLRFGMALMRASLAWADETLAAAGETRAGAGGRS
jgi:DNA-binding PadR family transcriptional regulator